VSADPAAPPPRPQPTGAVAEVLDRIDWDFDPEQDLVSPLVTTERYFRDFPWDEEATE
jgi:hypothetical protein